MTGHETERAGGQADCDVAIAMLVVENRAVETQAGIGAKREIGRIGHHKARSAFGAGANGLVAHHTVADIDLGRCRTRDAHDFVLDDDRFAYARLRLRMSTRLRSS